MADRGKVASRSGRGRSEGAASVNRDVLNTKHMISKQNRMLPIFCTGRFKGGHVQKHKMLAYFTQAGPREVEGRSKRGRSQVETKSLRGRTEAVGILNK